jgi:hypothetical protein
MDVTWFLDAEVRRSMSVLSMTSPALVADWPVGGDLYLIGELFEYITAKTLHTAQQIERRDAPPLLSAAVAPGVCDGCSASCISLFLLSHLAVADVPLSPPQGRWRVPRRSRACRIPTLTPGGGKPRRRCQPGEQ